MRRVGDGLAGQKRARVRGIESHPMALFGRPAIAKLDELEQVTAAGGDEQASNPLPATSTGQAISAIHGSPVTQESSFSITNGRPIVSDHNSSNIDRIQIHAQLSHRRGPDRGAKLVRAGGSTRKALGSPRKATLRQEEPVQEARAPAAKSTPPRTSTRPQGLPLQAAASDPVVDSAARTAGTATCSPRVLTGALLPRPFAPSSVWNEPTPTCRNRPSSAAYVEHLQSLIQQYGAWVNTTEWSTPVYTAGPDQPTARVTLDLPAGVTRSCATPWTRANT